MPESSQGSKTREGGTSQPKTVSGKGLVVSWLGNNEYVFWTLLHK